MAKNIFFFFHFTPIYSKSKRVTQILLIWHCVQEIFGIWYVCIMILRKEQYY